MSAPATTEATGRSAWGALRREWGAALAAIALFAACSRAPSRPNVLLITIDTWRADRLSAATGSARVTTPRLDALAREGVLCTHASTPRAKTTPALASLMTGLAPHAHGVRDLMTPLALEHATLAERLRSAGWRTGAVVGNYVLQARFSGLERGFEQVLRVVEGIRRRLRGGAVALGGAVVLHDEAAADGVVLPHEHGLARGVEGGEAHPVGVQGHGLVAVQHEVAVGSEAYGAVAEEA